MGIYIHHIYNKPAHFWDPSIDGMICLCLLIFNETLVLRNMLVMLFPQS